MIKTIDQKIKSLTDIRVCLQDYWRTVSVEEHKDKLSILLNDLDSIILQEKERRERLRGLIT